MNDRNKVIKLFHKKKKIFEATIFLLAAPAIYNKTPIQSFSG